MIVAHVSDLHVGERGWNEATARTLVASLEQCPAEQVLITGDLTDHGTFPETQAYLGTYGRMQKKSQKVPGNHDGGWNGVVFMPGRYNRLQEDLNIKLPYFEDVGEYRFIGLDTIRALRGRRFSLARGKIGEEQLAWLDRVLDTDQKCVVLLHHHPYERRPGLELLDANEFLITLGGRHHAVLYGHRHVASQDGRFFAADKTPSSRRYRLIDLETLEWEWHRF